MKNVLIIALAFVTFTACSQNNIPSKETQVKTAVKAAPKMYRDGAKVLGYNEKGEIVTLRKGSNDMICLADDPDKKGISVACYGKDLEPFMARGRELAAEGKDRKEKQKIRKKEIDNGNLKMPEEPSTLYVLSGKEKNYDAKKAELKDSVLRYVMYKPYMTGESTGLPTKPQEPGMPWLMNADTHRSHIMITPAD